MGVAATLLLHFMLFAVVLSPVVAQRAYAMSSSATGDQELSFHEAPYWVTLTIPKSRDYFENRAISMGSAMRWEGQRSIGDVAFTPPEGGAPYSALFVYIYDRYKVKDESVAYSINPTLQEFVVEYNRRAVDFFPALKMPQLKAQDTSVVRRGDRNWFSFHKWNTEADEFRYATMIDDKKMLIIDWLPPDDTFFHRKRAAKKQPEIDRMLESVRISRDAPP